jgi:hypothetical protein
MQEAIMSTRRPLVPIPEQERSVLVSDAAREAELIEEFMALLPNDLERSITVALGRNLSTDLRAALGGPDAIFDQLASVAREAGAPLDERGLARQVEAALREFGGDSAATVDPSAVKEETEHAKHALVTHWLSMLITAWDLWGRPSEGLPLDSRALLPDPSSCPRIDEWRDAKAAYNEALASSIALDMESDVQQALLALASKVLARAQRGPVDLPRGLAIAQGNGEVRLYHRRDAGRVTQRAQTRA